MRYLKFMALLLVAVLSLSVFAACGDNGDKKKDDSSATVNDDINANTPGGKDDSTEAAKPDKGEDGGKESAGQNSTGDSAVVDNSTKDPVDLPAPTVVAKNNNDGTVTISVRLPSGVGNGKVVVTVSDNLSYIDGSASSEVNGLINDDGVNFNGVAVSFASATFFDEDTVVLSADYKLKDGATLTEEDFWCDDWELGDGTVWLSKSTDCEIIKICR